MKTLQKLIAEGLPVGALVKYRDGSICQYLGYSEEKIFKESEILLPYNIFLEQFPNVFRDVKNKELLFLNLKSKNVGILIEPTTAYDSRIDPETLPIEEPFWTGWFVLDRIKREITKIEPCGWGFDLYYYNNSIVYSSICQPCLPPN